MDGKRAGCDVVIIGGGLVGSMASVMLQRRGLRTLVLESRPLGKEQKVVVGEAITEGSSVFLRHELGLTDWLKANAFRKFGFDFVIRPRSADGNAPLPRTIEDCHELLLSLTPLEKIPGAFKRLIPTFHVERTGMNAHVAMMAQHEGARWLHGASVENVALGQGKHTVHYSLHGDGRPHEVDCRWVLDASGRRTVLGRQLGITHPVRELNTAAVWNRFTNVRTDAAFWNTFQGIDRRRHTIHFTGPGFWVWWIHQNQDLTSVGVSFDKDQHQPNVKTDDRGFWEMMRKFPPVIDALEGARALEPYQYYAHLPYRSDHWIGLEGYALVGDAAWFSDALYSIGIETACRQLVQVVPMIVDACHGKAPCPKMVAGLNQEFDYCQDTVLKLNAFKYREGWARPHVVMQTALYELGEISELYNLQDKANWTPKMLAKHYRLQWSTKQRMIDQDRFQQRALADGDRDVTEPGLLKKALLPGWAVYGFTYPLWKLPNMRPYFFKITRLWGFSERFTQRLKFWPDALSWMASGPSLTTVINRLQERRAARS